MQILLTGGAGYVGSHCYYALQERWGSEAELIVLDNLSTGHRELLPDDTVFYEGDVSDEALLAQIFSQHEITAVMHFAGPSLVEESVAKPGYYHKHNVGATIMLLRMCVAHNVQHIVFSSTALVYGSQSHEAISEAAEVAPENPYADSKYMAERVLIDMHNAHDMHVTILRYFNVAGADPKGRTGQVSDEATHVIKKACEVVQGKREILPIYGTEYDTKDGTCIRDYVHVCDVAAAHVQALEYMLDSAAPAVHIFNCGYGKGYSVKEVVAATEAVSGAPLPVKEAPPRLGDAVALVADNSYIQRVLGWQPKHGDLQEIIRSALAWESTL